MNNWTRKTKSEKIYSNDIGKFRTLQREKGPERRSGAFRSQKNPGKEDKK